LNLICKIAPMKKQVYSITLVITVCLSAFSGCFGFGENEQTNPPILVDSDNDGLSDEQENILGTNASNPDSDGDGVYDFFETKNGTAMDTDADQRLDALDDDDDGDSIPTHNEHSDENGDGNPSDALDTDGDNIPDYLDNDDDNDSILTSTEEAYNAAFGDDVDNDNLPNYRDTDSDADGIHDRLEGNGDIDGDGTPNFLDPNDNDGPLGDLDGDGVTNQEEGSTDPVPPDTNNDGTPDYLDPGSDGGSNEVFPEQVRFLGSWHNEANGNEHWIFYSNWTQKYTTVVTDNSPAEPFTAELRFTYTFNESTFCQSILIGGDAPPDCFLYEFSSNDHVLTLYNNGEVMVVLRKD